MASGSIIGVPPQARFNLNTVSLASRRDRTGTSPDWGAIRGGLEAKGLQLRSFSSDAGLPLPSGVWAFEMLDAREKVVSSGKGPCENAALRSVLGEAVAAALLEAIETDAYWLSMRTRCVRGTFRDLQHSVDSRTAQIVAQLSDVGLRVHAGLIDFGRPLSIVHVVLESTLDALPALSHGLGSGVTHSQAIERALVEAVQVHAGLRKVVGEYWPQISLKPHTLAEPALVWSSPSFSGRVLESFSSAPSVSIDTPVEGVVTDSAQLGSWLEQRGFVPWVASLGCFQGLSVVRVFLEGGVSPFSERAGPSERMSRVARELGVRGLCFDPILT